MQQSPRRKHRRNAGALLTNVLVAVPIVAALAFAVWINVGRRDPEEALKDFGVKKGAAVPQLLMENAQGEPSMLASRVSGRVAAVVVVDPTCQHCHTELTHLQQLVRETPSLAAGLVIVAMGPPEMVASLRSTFSGLEIFYDTQRAMERRYTIPGVPALIVVDAAGRVADVRLGLQKKAVLDELLRQAQS